MPQIVVTTSGPESPNGREVFRERVVRSDLDSDQFAAHLVERLSWALSDADVVEQPAAVPVDMQPPGGRRAG